MAHSAWVPLLFVCVACHPARKAPSPEEASKAAQTPPSNGAVSAQKGCLARVHIEAPGRREGELWLTVHLECPETVRSFELPREAEPHVVDWVLQGPRIDYRIDLASLVEDGSPRGVTRRVGESWIAPVGAWLASPTSSQSDLDVTLEVTTSDPIRRRFETGLERDVPPDVDDTARYVLRAREVRAATYAAIGRLRDTNLELPGLADLPSSLHVAWLDQSTRLSDDVVAHWIFDSARIVGDFYRGFPVPRTMIAVVPVLGQSRIVHGNVLPESEPTIALSYGVAATKQDLYGDWILIHELLHLGFPSFVGEGAWLDEGLATYFEPIVRAQAGWKSELEVWTEFARNLPRGLRAVEGSGLAHSENARSAYWGGALLCLLADVEARRHLGTRLEDAARAVLDAGGHSSRVWKLDRAIEVMDAALGGPVLSELRERHVERGSPVELDRLFEELGVVVTKYEVRLRDDAPLSALRRALVGARKPPT